MSQSNSVLAFLCISFIGYLYVRKLRRSPLSNLPVPPGPRQKPIIGNLLDMPADFAWKTYHEWCKDLDTDILYLNVAGTSVIVLDTYEAAWDLLEKRSSKYSSRDARRIIIRARMPMINELMGWEFDFGFMQYSDLWREHRKLMHHSFHPAAARQFRPHELKAARSLLRRLLVSSEDITGNLRQLTGEIVISIAYGLDVESKDDPYVKLAEDGMQPLGSVAPGSYLVDVIPALKYVPDWMPGAEFKRKARVWRDAALKMIEVPYEVTKQKIENGTAKPSFVTQSLDIMNEGHDSAYNEENIKCVAGTMYAAGSDTTTAVLAFCILGLLQNPEVVRKAHKEIDSVVKLGQLPDFEDEDSLPYIHAIVKEALRWRDATPLAIPHYIHEDDEYKGYRIPAESVIVPNSWAMLHDENEYPDPFIFNPDRFMKDGKLNHEIRDPTLAAFGFGRRICPGRFLAISAMWITLASILAVFDIEKPIDQEGNAVEPSDDCRPGLIVFPVPFECLFKPRSIAAESLIRATSNEEYHYS